jgi:hypothetical protein
MPRKVLLATVNAGGGHRALRDSFARLIETEDPDHKRYETVLFDSANTSIEWIYHTTMAIAPRLQRFWWWLSDQWYFAPSARYGQPDLTREARAILTGPDRPDMIISTHLAPTIVFKDVCHELGLNVPIIGAVPDYGLPTRGFYPPEPHLHADYLIVMDDFPYRHYRDERGVSPDKLYLGGLATRAPFVELGRTIASGRFDRTERRAIVEQLTAAHPDVAPIDLSKPTVLFLGGSRWTEKSAPVLKRLAANPELAAKLNVVIVAGGHEKFLANAKRWFGHLPTFRIFGFVPPTTMAALMAVADVPVLGSIAPATMHELLEMRCGPLLVFHYIIGAEDAHIPYVEDNMIGLYEPDPDAMVDKILQIAGLRPTTPRLARLVSDFRVQAQRVREQHRARSRQFVEFLDGIPGGSRPAARHDVRVPATTNGRANTARLRANAQ